jgi:membrane protease YdiL (CAAX protease family)
MTALFILVFYLTTRIGLNSLWDQLNPVYSYLFEVAFVSATIFLYTTERKEELLNFKITKTNFLRLLPWPFLGFAFYRLAVKANILIPFDFKNGIGLILLLVVAPILEELIFRFSLWVSFNRLCKNKEAEHWASAIFFSIGHLIAIFTLPPDFRPFVLYQGMYVIILSLGASTMRVATRGVLGPVILHAIFNLGFYLGSLV